MPERPATLARPRHLWVMLCLLLASSVSAPVAQERVYAPLVQRERTTLVLVDVRVEDRAGNAVYGLTKEDFILRLDKKTVPIASFDEILATDGEVKLTELPDDELMQLVRLDVIRAMM